MIHGLSIVVGALYIVGCIDWSCCWRRCSINEQMVSQWPRGLLARRTCSRYEFLYKFNNCCCCVRGVGAVLLSSILLLPLLLLLPPLLVLRSLNGIEGKYDVCKTKVSWIGWTAVYGKVGGTRGSVVMSSDVL